MGGASYLPTRSMSHPDAITVCCEPGCPTLVRGASRCPQHHLPDRRGSRGYSTAAWQTARRMYLAGHPHCEAFSIENGTAIYCGEPATEVDHIDGLGPRGPRGTDPTNLRALCKTHHSQRTGRDHKPGSRALRGVA
jgi:5-methylcytosine-specific restriction protein A